jgi:hypothetical protein
MKRYYLTTAAAAVVLLSGCGSDVQRFGSDSLRVDTIGDTIRMSNPSVGAWGSPRTLVASTSIGELDGPIEESFGRVRSISSGADGHVYVLDDQARTVRVFDSTGSYLRSIGRQGEGPGEFTGPTAVGVRPDGHVLVRDPRASSVHVFDSTGAAIADWRVLSPVFATFLPVWSDRDLNAYITAQAPPDPNAPPGAGPDVVVLRISVDGVVADTIRSPGGGVASPELRAEASMNGGTSVYRSEVPFFPQSTYGVLPTGAVVRSLPDGSGIEIVDRTGAVLQITRDHQPVPIATGERGFYRQRVIDGMRRVVDDWSWDGPDIPDTKPYVNRVYAGIDGSIWVRIHVEGSTEEEGDPNTTDEGGGSVAWTEPVVFDVYGPDGIYLGMVKAPDEFALSPTPVFDSTGVWAVTRDDLGVQRAVRFELTPENAF